MVLTVWGLRGGCACECAQANRNAFGYTRRRSNSPATAMQAV